MSLSPGFSTEDAMAAVVEYMSVRHGERTAWLEGKPFSPSQIRRWRQSYLAGTIDLGLVPRHASGVRDFGSDRIRALQRELKVAQLRHAEEIGKLRAENEALQEGTVALGKAIGFLQEKSGQEPETPQEPEADPSEQTPPTNPSNPVNKVPADPSWPNS